MSELSLVVLTSSLTIIGGITVYVIGQVIEKFLIEPIYEQAKFIGEIADSLIFYADIISNPGYGKPKKIDDASKQLRQQASQLMAKTHAIRSYKLMQFLRIVPKHKDIISARQNLIGLSNSVHREKNTDANYQRERVAE